METDFPTTPLTWHAVRELEAERNGLREALAEIHEYECGCDQPGRADLCVAPCAPVYTILAAGPGESDG